MTQQLEYAFDNQQPDATTQLACLERYLDPLTAERIAPPVIHDGDHCWEIGAGAGSVARMMAREVGWSGLVVATDIDTAQLVRRDGLLVFTHDVRRDRPPEGGPFQLIHARLVLMHLPERRQILRTLAGALAPGGWLVIEDFDCTVGPRVLDAPSAPAESLFAEVVDTCLGVLQQRGVDLGWAHEVYREMARLGLTNIDTLVHAENWPGGSWGAQLYEVNSRQLQAELLDAGIGMTGLMLFRSLMRDPRFAAMSYPFVSTRGRRPA